MPFTLPGGGGGSGGGGGGGGSAPTTLYAATDAAGLEVHEADAALTTTADPNDFEVLVVDFQPSVPGAPRQLVSAHRNGAAWPATSTANTGFVVSENASNAAEVRCWRTGATNLTLQGDGNANWSGTTVRYRLHALYGFRALSDFLGYGRGPAGPAGAAGAPGQDGAAALSDDDPLAPGTAAAGTSTRAARADHVHPEQTVASGPPLSDAAALAPGTAAAGTSTDAARADHRHPEQPSADALDTHTSDLTLADVGRVIYTGTDLRRVSRRHGTPPTVVWQAYSLNSDVSTLWGESTGTYRWRGRHPGGSSISNPAVGDVICTVQGNFEHYISSVAQGTGWFHLAPPSGWLGVFLEGTSEADVEVSEVGQVAQYGDGLHSVTSFAAGTAERAVTRALPKPSFVDLTDTPAALGAAGQRLAVNAGADALEFVDATAEQTSGGGAGWTTEEPVTARNELAGNSLNEPFSNTQISWNDFTIASIAKTALREIEVVISIQDRFDYYGRWGPSAIRRIGAYPGGWRDDDVTTWPWTNNNQRIPCFYLSGENDTGSDKRDPPLLLPSFFQANSRRLQEIESFFIFLIQGGVSNENLVGIRIYYNGDINCYLERLAITYAG